MNKLIFQQKLWCSYGSLTSYTGFVLDAKCSPPSLVFIFLEISPSNFGSASSFFLLIPDLSGRASTLFDFEIAANIVSGSVVKLWSFLQLRRIFIEIACYYIQDYDMYNIIKKELLEDHFE